MPESLRYLPTMLHFLRFGIGTAAAAMEPNNSTTFFQWNASMMPNEFCRAVELVDYEDVFALSRGHSALHLHGRQSGEREKQKKVHADCKAALPALASPSTAAQLARPAPPSLHSTRPSLSKVVASFSSRKFLFRNIARRILFGEIALSQNKMERRRRGGRRRAEGGMHGGPCAHVLPSFALFRLRPLRPPKSSLSNFSVVNCSCCGRPGGFLIRGRIKLRLLYNAT